LTELYYLTEVNSQCLESRILLSLAEGFANLISHTKVLELNFIEDQSQPDFRRAVLGQCSRID